MRIFSLILVGCVATSVAGCAQQSSPVLGTHADLDYANPIVLNELAAASVQRGDIGRAWVLLERANRLAPYDKRISANLNVVRALRNGGPLPSPTVEAPSSASAAAPVAAPPIWAKP